MQKPIYSGYKPKVAAVSYLNTVPLVWGALHGPQRDDMQLEFRVPSECADMLRSGVASIGILPVIEIARQGLEIFPGTGIACHGPVRSILLISKVPFNQIRRLSCDRGSRTSVMLARLILRERFGVEPEFLPPAAPLLGGMLLSADAALVIGDPALELQPEKLGYEWLDLGEQWVQMTGLPMVFAMWAGPADWVTPALEKSFRDSLEFGLTHLERIVEQEAINRPFTEAVIRDYLTKNIVFRLGAKDYEGMRTFLRLASEIEPGLKCPVMENVLV